MAKALTQKAVENLKPGTVRREIPDRLLPGLYLVVQPKPSGAKSWAVRYRIEGRTRKHTLGTLERYDLKQAREAAGAALRLAAKGDDPALLKKQARMAPETSTKVEDVIEEYIQRYCRRNKTWKDGARALGFKPDPDDDQKLFRTGKGLAKRWKGRAIGSITRRDVLALLDDTVDQGYPIAANRRLAMMRKFFNWCVERGIVVANPCSGISAPSSETSRDRVLADPELRSVWHATDKVGWPFGPIVRLLALTGCRREEVAAMRWPELNIEAATWTIPPGRTKNADPKVVPLSEPVVAILKALPRLKCKAGFVFAATDTTSFSGYSKSKLKLDAAIEAADGELEPWTLHDLRRTIATGLQRLGVRLEVTEAVLGHVSGSRSGIVGIYQRYDWATEKRAALDAWAKHVLAVVSGAADPNNVIRLHGAA